MTLIYVAENYQNCEAPYMEEPNQGKDGHHRNLMHLFIQPTQQNRLNTDSKKKLEFSA